MILHIPVICCFFFFFVFFFHLHSRTFKYTCFVVVFQRKQQQKKKKKKKKKNIHTHTHKEKKKRKRLIVVTHLDRDFIFAYLIHYENMPIQIYWKVNRRKIENFQTKKSNIFHISAQNIDCGYSLEPPRRGGSNEYPHPMFWGEIIKITFTPVNPSFTI